MSFQVDEEPERMEESRRGWRRVGEEARAAFGGPIAALP
jgi:hypothetical protein